MKTLIYLLLSVLVLSIGACGREDVEFEPELIVGIGEDPKLNVTSYTFPVEGGELDVYSTLGYLISGEPHHTYYTFTVEDNMAIYDAVWYVLSYSELSYDTIHIKVYPNDTGQERKLNLLISAADYGCTTNYAQSAN